jgi:hypothetical protein
LKDDEIRSLALRFIRSSFIDSGEIKTFSAIEPDVWEGPSSSHVSLHDVLDDLELKTTSLLRAERGWRITKLLLKDGSVVPRELAHAQPYYIRPRKQALEVYYLTNEPPRRGGSPSQRRLEPDNNPSPKISGSAFPEIWWKNQRMGQRCLRLASCSRPVQSGSERSSFSTLNL